MRVVYKAYLQRHLLAELDKARNLDREIEKFILTKEELSQLEHEMCMVYHGFNHNSFHGVKVEIEK